MPRKLFFSWFCCGLQIQQALKVFAYTDKLYKCYAFFRINKKQFLQQDFLSNIKGSTSLGPYKITS